MFELPGRERESELVRAQRRKEEKGKPGPAWILAVAGATGFSSALLLLAPQATAAFLPTHRGGAGVSAAPLICVDIWTLLLDIVMVEDPIESQLLL